MRAVVTCLTLTLTALVVWGAATAAPAAAATTRPVKRGVAEVGDAPRPSTRVLCQRPLRGVHLCTRPDS